MYEAARVQWGEISRLIARAPSGGVQAHGVRVPQAEASAVRGREELTQRDVPLEREAHVLLLHAQSHLAPLSVLSQVRSLEVQVLELQWRPAPF